MSHAQKTALAGLLAALVAAAGAFLGVEISGGSCPPCQCEDSP